MHASTTTQTVVIAPGISGPAYGLEHSATTPSATYSFVLPGLAPGAIRELRDPDNGDEDDD